MSPPGRVAAPYPPDRVRVADLDRRFHAFAVDRLIGWGIDAAVAGAAIRLLVVRDHVLAGVLAIVATVLVVGLVSALLLGTYGATPGTWLLGLRVVRTDTGEPIGAGPAILRTCVLGLAAVPFGWGLAALAWTIVADTARLRRGWHDRLVSSVVVDVRPVAAAEEVGQVGQAEQAAPGGVVNLTALRLVPSRRTPEPAEPEHATVRTHEPMGPQRDEPPVRVVLPSPAWEVAFDTGERVVVDTLVLVGRRPEPRRGEDGARLVGLSSADLSVSQTHAQVVVAADGALVVTDRASTNGSTLVRRGMPRPLDPGRPTTLLDGDSVTLGDRTMTVHRSA